MKKKLLTLLLAATMLVSSSVAVLAADPAELTDVEALGTGQAVEGTGEVNLPVIKVTVPTEVAFVLNPFQLEYEDTEGDSGIASNAQVATIAQKIESYSNVAVKVNVVEAYATPSEGVTVATATTAGGKVTTKSVFLWVAFGAEEGLGEVAYDAKSTTQLVLGTEEKKASKLAVAELAAAADEDTPEEVSFMLRGDMVANPVTVNSDKTTTANPWTDSDTVSVSMKFTFEPQIVTAGE